MHFLRGILTILDHRERVRLFVLIILDVLISGLDVIFLGLTILVINSYVQNGTPHYLSWLPHSFADKNSLWLISAFFVSFAIKNLIAYWVSTQQYGFVYKVATRLSKQNILKYLKEDYLKFVHVDSSVHIRRISQQPIEFSYYILTNFEQIISQSLLVLFTICAILFYHASLFLLLFLLLMPAVALVGWLLKRQLKQVRQNIKKANEGTLKNLQEALGGYIESNIYEKDQFFAERYYTQQEQLNESINKQQALQSLPSRLIEIFAILGFFILILVNKWSVNTPAVDLLTIGIFMAAAYKIIPGMVKILNSAGQMKTYEFTLHDLLPAEEETVVKPVAPKSNINSIAFNSVSFRYKESPVLDGISFEMLSGDFAGISGNSGRGKTTIINLLLGFIDPDSGAVIINNQQSDSIERKGYWNRISYIKQQTFLIHDSLLKNITLSEGSYDSEKLTKVLSFCGLDPLVEQYADGINHVITENGKNLSGGQRQRIMLARAMYHDFDLLILDEPFSEMDQLSENSILQQLQQLIKQGKMIIFISHNQPSLTYCNKIISLNE